MDDHASFMIMHHASVMIMTHCESSMIMHHHASWVMIHHGSSCIMHDHSSPTTMGSPKMSWGVVWKQRQTRNSHTFFLPDPHISYFLKQIRDPRDRKYHFLSLSLAPMVDLLVRTEKRRRRKVVRTEILCRMHRPRNSQL